MSISFSCHIICSVAPGIDSLVPHLLRVAVLGVLLAGEGEEVVVLQGPLEVAEGVVAAVA